MIYVTPFVSISAATILVLEVLLGHQPQTTVRIALLLGSSLLFMGLAGGLEYVPPPGI